MLVVNRESPFKVFFERPRRENIIVVMLSGKIGSGKSTVAEALVDYINERFMEKPHIVRARRFSFAKHVRDIAKALGWDGEKDEIGRRLLQTIGHTGRYYSNGRFWANSVVIDILSESKMVGIGSWCKTLIAVIDDFRYPEEFFVMVENFKHVYTVRVVPPMPLDIRDDMETDIMKHPSENSLDSWSLWNGYLYNVKDSNPRNHAEHIFNAFLGGHLARFGGE